MKAVNGTGRSATVYLIKSKRAALKVSGRRDVQENASPPAYSFYLGHFRPELRPQVQLIHIPNEAAGVVTENLPRHFFNLRPVTKSELAAADFGGEGLLVLAFERFLGEEVAADDEGDEDGGDEHGDDEEES